MNDTTRRFLTEILQRVPESRIVELRLFPAIRQAGIESGVAVLAVEPGFDEIPDATVALEGEDALGMEEVELATRTDEVVLDLAARPDDPEGDDSAIEPGDISEADPLASRRIPFDTLVEVEFDRERSLNLSHEGVAVAEVPPAVMGDATAGDDDAETVVAIVVADAAVEGERAESIALGDILALPSPTPVHAARGHERLAILCARYRLVLKGPDRGKWDLGVVHQADAPLATLERVIAGVVRRSGEGVEPERYSAAELRERLDAPPWVEGAAA